MSSPSSTADGDFDFVDEKKTRKPSKGRKLMRWNPDVDQLVLLCVDHVCIKEGISIPWDKVAKKITDNLSGEAIKQHLAKLHKYREETGRQVPEKLDKSARCNVKLANGTKGRGRGAVKDEDDDDGMTPAKGATLLYTFPEKKGKAKKAKAVAADTEPTTPVTTGRGGRSKKSKTREDNEEDETAFKTPTKPSSKRGRTSKKAAKRDEAEDDDAAYGDDESPSKKQRTTKSLRPTFEVNYKEQLEGPDEEDEQDAKQEEEGDDQYQDSVPVKPEFASRAESWAEAPPAMKSYAASGDLSQYQSQDYAAQTMTNNAMDKATGYGYGGLPTPRGEFGGAHTRGLAMPQDNFNFSAQTHGLPSSRNSFDVFGNNNSDPFSNNMISGHPSVFSMPSPAPYTGFNNPITAYHAQTPTQASTSITPDFNNFSFDGGDGEPVSEGTLFPSQNTNFSGMSGMDGLSGLSSQSTNISSTTTSFSGASGLSSQDTNRVSTHTSFSSLDDGAPLETSQSMEATLPSMGHDDDDPFGLTPRFDIRDFCT